MYYEDAADHGFACLDDKFWVWETLETAVLADMDQLSYNEVMIIMGAFSMQMKGSDDLCDEVLRRHRLEHATLTANAEGYGDKTQRFKEW